MDLSGPRNSLTLTTSTLTKLQLRLTTSGTALRPANLASRRACGRETGAARKGSELARDSLAQSRGGWSSRPTLPAARLVGLPQSPLSPQSRVPSMLECLEVTDECGYSGARPARLLASRKPTRLPTGRHPSRHPRRLARTSGGARSYSSLASSRASRGRGGFCHWTPAEPGPPSGFSAWISSPQEPIWPRRSRRPRSAPGARA